MPSSEPPQAVYARLMFTVDSSRGYALWFPEPASNLPDDYHRTGLQIGDVGIVREDGSFDVLFNISSSAEDPINRRGVPPNFKQVVLDPRSDICGFPSSDNAGLVLATQSVEQTTQTLSGSGALLALPEGAGKADLVNSLPFLDEACKNAVSWYQFAYYDRGRAEINNDSLYLITGYHKARSWSLASFSRADGSEAAALSFS
ncbi:hypothetical protein BU15DRAFT_55166, partial [Melanogaster broomeanus]